MIFEIFDGDAFQTLKKMAECEYHILNISTFSLSSAFLNCQQPNSKVFYPQMYVKIISKEIIPYKEWVLV